jgi:hypothetical protein
MERWVPFLFSLYLLTIVKLKKSTGVEKSEITKGERKIGPMHAFPSLPHWKPSSRIQNSSAGEKEKGLEKDVLIITFHSLF